jgi:hypothetical protein
MLTEAGRARREAAVRWITEDLAPVAARLGVAPEAALPALVTLRHALDRARDPATSG